MYSEMLLSQKRRMLFGTWMDLEGIMLHEIHQMEKDEYCMISLAYGIQNTKQNK